MLRSGNQKRDTPESMYSDIMKNLTLCHFQVKAVIQDIWTCRESMEALNELNKLGRTKIAQLREEIEKLDVLAKETPSKHIHMALDSHRHQFASTLKAFKEANMNSLVAIEKLQREQLMSPPEKDGDTSRSRKHFHKSDLLKMSTGVTDHLLSISRQLADTTQRSQDTLDNLVSSSSTVKVTQSELQNTAGSISQSSKLLKKYGRREFTDKVIMFFAFLFFVAVVLYIVHKRLF